MPGTDGKIFGVRLGILRFGGIHKKVGHDFPGETFRVLKQKKENMANTAPPAWFWRPGIG